MNKNTEAEYWARAISEVLQASELTIAQLAERLGVTERQVFNWQHGSRPTGLVAIRFYAYRQTLALLKPKIFPN